MNAKNARNGMIKETGDMIRTLILSVFVLLSASFSVHAEDVKPQETAYERIMRTNTLRCGYFIYPPFLDRDLKTGAFSGIYPDIFNEIATQSGLKVVWAEEIGSDTMFEGLKTKRYDAICAPLTYTVARATEAFFTIPLVHVPFYVYVRANETRFDTAPETTLNSPETTFIGKDGDLTEILAHETFPNAKSFSMPGLTEAATMLTALATGKGDAIVAEPIYAHIYMNSNPDKIKRLASLKPVQVVTGVAGVPFGDSGAQQFLNTSIQALIDNGFVEKTIKKHVPNSEELYLPVRAYGVR
jgi:polar amino acid transport system substrate-binding protein